MNKIKGYEDLIDYCESKKTFITKYEDWKCYLDNWEILEFDK